MKVPGPKLSVTVQKVALTGDGMGGQKEGWTTDFTTTAVVCAPSAYERMVAGQVTEAENRRAFFEYTASTATLSTAKRLKIGTEIWAITGVTNPGTAGHHIEVDIKRHGVE